MPASTDDYFKELKEWSKRKLDIIDKYLDAAARILGSKDVVYYIDGFAGPGTYQDGSKGSPVRAVELAAGLQLADRSYALRCINVEEIPENFANLEKATVAGPGIVTNLSGEFNHHVDRILTDTALKPAVLFLDPFGLDGIDWEQLVKIIHRPAPTDLWIRFDAAYVRRLDGFFGKTSPEAQAKIALLQRVFGISDGEDLHRRLAGDDKIERREKTVIVYMDRLRSAFVEAKGDAFVGAYPIRTIQGQVKYYLVFAGSHPKAAMLASHVVYSVQDGYQRDVDEYQSDKQQLNFLEIVTPSQAEVDAKKAKDFAQSLADKCHGRTLTRLEACGSVWGLWFGRLGKRHVTAAIKLLTASGRVQAIGNPSEDNTTLKFSSGTPGAIS